MNILNVLKNALYLLFGNIFVKFISAFTIIYVANFLNAEKYGVLSLSLALSSIFLVLSELGLNNTLIREATKYKISYEKLIMSYFKIRLLLALMVIILIILTIEFAYHDNNYKISMYIIILLNTLGNMLINFSVVHYQIIEKMKYITLITSFSSLTISISLWIAIYLKGDLLAFSLSYGISAIIVGIISFLYFLRHNYNGIFIRDFFTYKIEKSILKDLNSFTIATVISTFRGQMGPVVLEKVSSVSQVGLFSVGYKIPSILYSIPQAFATAFYTILFKYGNQNETKSHNKLTIIQLKIMSFIGLALWFPFLFYSDYIIGLMFQDSWSDSARILTVISIVVFLQSINYPLGDSLTTSGFQKNRTKVLVFSVIIGFVSLVSLGYSFGALGGAYSIVIMEIVMLVGLTIYKSQGFKIVISSLSLNLVAFFIIVILKLTLFNLHPLIEIFILELIYCITVILFYSKLLFKIIKSR